MKLLSMSNPKTMKGEKKGYITGILHLAPHESSGIANVCRYASEGCSAACLYYQGRGRMENTKNARIRKTKMFFQEKEKFFELLIKDIQSLVRKAERDDVIACVRLNGTSDIPWERVRNKDGNTIFELFPDVQFYDYTKWPSRSSIPDNYHLTFSLSESNEEQAKAAMEHMNVAAVFRDELPETWWGYPVHDGDETDLRFLDPAGHVIGLKAKGSAKKDTSGFVQN